MNTTNTVTSTFTINVHSTLAPRDLIKVIEKYKRRNDDGDGSAGVAAMVSAGPSHGGGGMYLDEP